MGGWGWAAIGFVLACIVVYYLVWGRD